MKRGVTVREKEGQLYIMLHYIVVQQKILHIVNTIITSLYVCMLQLTLNRLIAIERHENNEFEDPAAAIS